jgi:hypothetical protein
LPAAFLQALKEFVLEQGGGAPRRRQCFGPSSSHRSFPPLRAILPSRRPPRSRTDRTNHRAKYTTPWRSHAHPPGRGTSDLQACRRFERERARLVRSAALPQRVRARVGARRCILSPKEGGDVIVATQRQEPVTSSSSGRTTSAGVELLSRRPEILGLRRRYLALGKKVSGGERSPSTPTGTATRHPGHRLRGEPDGPRRKPVEKDRVEVSIELAEPTRSRARRAASSTETKPSPSATSGSGSGSGSTSVRLNLLPIAGRPGWYGAIPRRRPADTARRSRSRPGDRQGLVRRRGAHQRVGGSFPRPRRARGLARKTGSACPLDEIGQVPDRIGDRSVTGSSVGRVDGLGFIGGDVSSARS